MKFWNFAKTEEGRTLYLDGYIAEESWFEDDVTPKIFKEELEAERGDITLFINSPGGDCFAASRIYTMLKEYEGKVTVKIDGIAASAASVIAMAGDEVLMSPTAMLMIHNPATIVWGEVLDMKRGIEVLSEVKESIINAYESKAGLTRQKISTMMDKETWMSAGKALELGFCDEVLYTEKKVPDAVVNGFLFDKMTVTNHFIGRLNKSKPTTKSKEKVEGTDVSQLAKRLELIK
ncbi:head maturation protease, ClpP-related [Proteinivorax hydrogeniformans]|uniref:ATP-dependent Clp protease proteolytic subunit n=2 Tax=Proteinivorax TaxID=1491776 RepID=A0AAU7VKA1_9FIRM